MELLKVNNSENLLATIQSEALDLANLSYDRAFAIDEANIAIEVDNFAFMNLSDIFFNKLAKEPLFSGMFHEDNLELVIKSFADFLYQRCGGGSQYTDRNGFLSISEKHSEIDVTVERVEKWCDVMEDSLYRMKSDFNENHRQAILDFLQYQGYEMVVWQKYKQTLIKRGPLF